MEDVFGFIVSREAAQSVVDTLAADDYRGDEYYARPAEQVAALPDGWIKLFIGVEG